MKRQIKTKLARILCTALSLCMILALIPAAFATTAENFTIDMVNDVENATEAKYDTTKNNRWAYGTSNTAVLDGNAPYGLKVSSSGANQYVTIEFIAPATGNYKVTYDYVLYSNGAIGNVYVVPFTEDIPGVISGDKGKIISDVYYNINYYSNSKNGDKASKTSEEYVSLVENERYLVVFVVSEGYEVSGVPKYRMYPSVLTFTKQAEPGITINYNIKDIIAAKQQANFGDGGVAFSDLFNYEETKGFFDFVTASRENTGESSSFCCYRNFIQFADDSESHIVFELNVPVNGEYSIKVDTRKNFTAPVKVFLSQDKTDYMNEAFLIGTYNGIADSESTVDVLTAGGTVWKKELDAGKYYIAFTGKESDNAKGSLGNLYLYTGGGEGESPVYMGALLKADKTVMNVDDIANLEVIAYMSDGNPADTAVEWESDNEDVATVNNGKVTAISSGVANISAVVTYNGKAESFTKVITVNDAELTDAFDDAVKADAPSDYIAPTVSSIDATGIVGTPVLQADGSYKITAPETVAGKGEFLYWKKAMTTNEKIVSLLREFNYVPEGNERNILVAVYEGDITSTSPKCYNANGQYIPDAQPIDADLPSMAGYGKAYKWEQYKDTNVWVAQYEAETPIADIDVTVTGDNTSGGGTNLAYGAEVICKATGENFKCWKKTYGDGTAKIVSTDAEYTFNAWEDCTVTAIYEEHTYTGSKMKIIIDSFVAGEETGVMAEFLGFDNNVVEKGIMFEDNRIAMTTVGNQFSVIADKPGTYVGYAIVRESDGLKLITDGSYTKNAN